MKRTILDLSAAEARRYFLHASRYCTIKLPLYFDFQPLLNALDEIIGTQHLEDLKRAKPRETLQDPIKYEDPGDVENVNYKFLTNKDGNYAWRPLTIINPAIYVCMVNRITEKDNWEYIQKRFRLFQGNKRISCYSIPLETEESDDQLREDTASNIKNWWERIEQQSIELALEFNTVFSTDITDCYSSIYSHFIGTALHEEKARDQEQRNKPTLIGCIIDKQIQQMSYRRTNGIPQGSVLMDFLAEIVLGYVDLEVSKKIEEINRDEKEELDYQILRYRDDYKIFANSEEDAVKIARVLSEVLSELNLKLNVQKTFMSNQIIRDVVKSDKRYWNEAKQGEKTLQKHLLLIHSLAEKHPNSGTLATAMSKYIDRLYPLKTFKEDSSKVLISILVDIAYNNPRVYPSVIVGIGKILSIEPDKGKIKEIYNLIEKKFEKKSNIGYWKVWLQRLTIKKDRKKEISSDEMLCRIAAGDLSCSLWNNSWLKDEYQDVFKRISIFSEEQYKSLKDIPEPHEARVFGY